MTRSVRRKSFFCCHDFIFFRSAKPPRDVTADQVRAHAKAIGMPGTLAIDRDWSVLDRWMPPEKRSFTSLTFVLDKKGKIRNVHRGGTIEPGDAKELSQQIDALLAQTE